MQSVDIIHLEGMRFAVRRGEAEVVVDRPPADGGPDTAFRSGELLLGGLGTCTLGGMITFAVNSGIDLTGLRATVSAEERQEPKRLDEIAVAVAWDAEIPERRVASLERVAHHCKIHSTLTSQPRTSLELRNGA